MFSGEVEREQVDRRRIRLAALYSLPIGMVGGLIGLGGAEFRLPVLAGPLGYRARQAVALNLAVTLVTVVAALGTRSTAFPHGSLSMMLPALFGLIGGSVLGASLGPMLAGRLSDRQFGRMVFVLLIGLGGGLMLDSVLAYESEGLIDHVMLPQLGAGILLGSIVGLVSSLLGVAGGELLIPTLVFAFGVDIKTAGTASLLISIPMVVVGLVGHWRQRTFSDRQAWAETVFPMSAGSTLGATAGGLLVNAAPPALLKSVLAVILIYSAGRVFLRESPREPAVGMGHSRS